MTSNMMYLNQKSGETTLVCLECLSDIVIKLNSLDRLIDIDNKIAWKDMVKYKPNRKFTMFFSEKKRVYVFV